MDRVLYETEGGIAVLTLNRPEKRNAIDDALIEQLDAALGRAAADDAVRVIVIRGAGKDFCAGADLSQLERVAAGADPIQNLEDASALADLLIAIRRNPKPIIAAVHGNAFAGGAGLATACDMIVCADSARFAYTEVRLGFVPAMVMALLRRILGEKLAFELAAFGDVIEADEAFRIGLVNRVVPERDLEHAAIKFARDLASRSPSALRLIKRLFYGIDGVSFEQAITRGAEVNALARATPDCQEGVRAFLEKRRS